MLFFGIAIRMTTTDVWYFSREFIGKMAVLIMENSYLYHRDMSQPTISRDIPVGR